MIKDKFLELSLSQAVTASAPSTNVIPHKAEGSAIGDELYAVVRVSETALAAGAATVEFKIETSVDEAFTSPIQLYSSGPIGKAALTANKEVVKVKMPHGAKKFTRGYYAVATGPLTAGKFDWFFTPTPELK